MYTPEQVQALLAQGYPLAQIQAAMGVQAPAAPQVPQGFGASAPAATSQALATALAGASYGVSSSGRKLPDGSHVVCVTKMEYKTGLQYGDRFIVSFDLESSSNPNAHGQYSIAIDPADKWGYGPDEIKGILAVANEAKDPRSTVRERWEGRYLTDAISDAQPLTGARLCVRSETKIAEKSGNSFIKYTDWRVAGATPAPAPAPMPAPTGLGLPAMPAGLPPLTVPPAAPQQLPPLPGMPSPLGAPQGQASIPGWPAGLPFPGGAS